MPWRLSIFIPSWLLIWIWFFHRCDIIWNHMNLYRCNLSLKTWPYMFYFIFFFFFGRFLFDRCATQSDGRNVWRKKWHCHFRNVNCNWNLNILSLHVTTALSRVFLKKNDLHKMFAATIRRPLLNKKKQSIKIA